ncbi:MAG: hypothetical protein PHN49_04220 [Candidatus Omnitrophica bacterium]|nr:hypothetical protein [Candidatus Omnitrophota bacterium]MDD5670827.1 hypothetical protein [Candidatus Omnitrophota bacterium]
MPAKNDIVDLMFNIESGFQEVFNTQLIKTDAKPETLRKAHELAETKYRGDYKMIQRSSSVQERCFSEELEKDEMLVMVGQ